MKDWTAVEGSLTILVLLIKAIRPGGRLTKQFFRETKATSARTAGAIVVKAWLEFVDHPVSFIFQR